MRTEPELLNERLKRLAIVLDEIMPRTALLVRDALDLLKAQEKEIENLKEIIKNADENVRNYKRENQ